MNVSPILLLSAVLAFAQISNAAENTNLKDTLQEVVVTGTPVQTSRNYVPSTVTVVTRSEIESSGESSLLKILNGRVPGLFVTEKGVAGYGVSSGAAGQITMRGVGGSPTTGVLVLIDGNPQFMGIFGHPIADTYLASEAERVEVIRGPASMLYGSNAMGGVVNILTKKSQKKGFAGEALLKYCSFNTMDLSLSGSFSSRHWDLFASLNRNSTDGYRDHSAFDLTNGYFKAKYYLDKHISVYTDLNLTRFNAKDPGPDTAGATTGYNFEIFRSTWSYFLDHRFDRFSGVMRAYRNYGVHDITDGFHSEDFNNGLSLNESIRLLDATTLTLGLDGCVYGGKATQTTTSTLLTDTTVVELGGYAFIRQTLFDRLTLHAGIRRQYHTTYGKEWIPTGGFAWEIRKDLTWKASFGKGFRSPTLRELFLWNHNSDLQPERIWNYETSFLKTFKTWNTNLEVTAYFLQGDNLIVAGNMGKLYNSGKVNNKGLELAFGCEPLDKLGFQLIYSHVLMETPVYGTPRNHLFVNGTYQLGKFRLSSGLRWVEHLKTVTGSADASAFQTYTLLNARVSWMLRPSLELSLTGDNLLNQTYETIRYYTMPGATLMGGIRYRF
jgi:outer membrane cobalamin receptor